MQVFQRKILDFIERENLLRPGQRVLVACSGGIDSVALLVFAAETFKNLQVDVAGIHVDHMLRGEESAEDGRFVKGLCEDLGIPFFGGHVPVPAILNEKGGNVQDICRSGRYAFFSEVMKKEGYDCLTTAHHAEDQLETVLMQLSKGSVPTGISIKREMDGGTVIRPFLPVMKEELLAYLKERDKQFREDPSNESDAYLRNRLRHHVAPIILSENPAAAVNAVKMTADLQQDEALLANLANERFNSIVSFTEDGYPTFDTNMFADMHTALQKRFIPLLLNYLYAGESISVEYNSALLDQLHHHLSVSHGNSTIDLPRGFRFVREYDKVSIMKAGKDHFSERCILPKGEWVRWGNMLLSWDDVDRVDKGACEYRYFDMPDHDLPLYLRSRKDGDRILLPGMDHEKRLSRLFIDEKIGVEKRLKLPIVTTSKDEICAIPGVRYGIRFKSKRTEREKYIFRFKKL
ncbi:tRNA lysidine(34) synthetase TilS [Sporosarcina thermotolerans]|uniref:tRNA(Ile)-lysidine synthase n=2 Tax=Sporosarcina thermotolerans TaxID=633404 RepID=A0AAW9ACB9_9BACL|nr:tRNA lysidine(34) synthetase TilS [Sporosarcina thermotolerans]MDW0118709.1 tRNA lysidine(34) synthetase TilS [Sporosarcina thermotolerans]